MALFRKKKNEASSKALPEKPVIGSPQTNSTGPATPLYARFASTAQAPPNKVVSGPKLLQQRPSFALRQNSDDSRRRVAPSNPNLRAAASSTQSLRSTKADKPLPPPGRPTPDSEVPPVLPGRSPLSGLEQTLSSPQSIQQQSPQFPHPPTSFTREGVAPHNISARKSAATSLMSDIPDHMFNLHNLDFGDESDREPKKFAPPPSLPPGAAKPQLTSPSQRRVSKQSVPRQSEQPVLVSRLPTRVPQPIPVTSPPGPSRHIEEQRLQSPPLPRLIPQSKPTLPPNGRPPSHQIPVQPVVPTKAGRRISSLPQPPAPSSSNSTSASDASVPRPAPDPRPLPPLQQALINRSTSRSTPHAALMQRSKSPSKRQTMPAPPSATKIPEDQPPRHVGQDESPYTLATPKRSASVIQTRTPSQRRVINLNDSAPLSPTNITPPSSELSSGSSAVRRGPLIFTNGTGSSSLESPQGSPPKNTIPNSSSHGGQGPSKHRPLPQPVTAQPNSLQNGGSNNAARRSSKQQSRAKPRTPVMETPPSTADSTASSLHAFGSRTTLLSTASGSTLGEIGSIPSSSSSSARAGSESPVRRKDSSSPVKHRAPVLASEPLTPPYDHLPQDDRKAKQGHRLVKQKSNQHIRAALPNPPDTPSKVDDETMAKAGLPLDDDPFAAPEIKVLGNGPIPGSEQVIQTPNSDAPPPPPELLEPTTPTRKEHTNAASYGFNVGTAPISPPISPPSSRQRADAVPVHPPPDVAELDVHEDRDPAPFPLPYFLLESPRILRSVLTWLNFYEFWTVICVLEKGLRTALFGREDLKEEILERYLGIVGYERWPDPSEAPEPDRKVISGRAAMLRDKQRDEAKEPLKLTFRDLIDYMRGVSMPTHEYARTSAQHIHQIRKVPRDQRNPEIGWQIVNMAASTRAYTRVVLRLRAQAERMQREKDRASTEERRGRERDPAPPNAYYNISKQSGRSVSRNSSRAPSPTQSMFSQSHHGHSGMSNHGHGGHSPQRSPSRGGGSPPLEMRTSTIFNSPLYRQRRAPLLRVFVPSPEGTWLSDASVLECEAELRRAGVMNLLRPGDIVWDIAVGDEGNVGRLVWDGSYLIDLDYTYNNVGDLPKYMPALAFPPSYFHKVIRTSASSSNPIIHLDISPWGEEIASRLQLLQDRVRTETPQGAYHNVVRWVHRSSFVVRPPLVKAPSSAFYDPRRAQQLLAPPRIPIPRHQGMFVDAGWYGTIVVETEGTNEALADFQLRCGPAAFPAATRVNHGNKAVMEREADQRRVFRIMREKSRPGEIWIKTVTAKERIL